MTRRTILERRTLLTGASSGIGRALAIELARRGARLVLVARRERLLRELAAEIDALQTRSGGEDRADLGDDQSISGDRVRLIIGDITDPAIRQRAVDCAAQSFGGLDLVVNNAGAGSRGRFEESTSERLRAVMELDFFAVAELIRLALPHLIVGYQPMIVNIGSVLGHRAIPFASEYCAAKFALRGLSESLRAELSRLRIDMLVVSPGATSTEFSHNLIGAGAYPWREASSVTAEAVARATARAIERGKSEIFVNWRGRLLVWVNRIAPRLVDRVMARFG